MGYTFGHNHVVESGGTTNVADAHEFEIDRAAIVEDACRIAQLIETYSTKVAEAKRVWHLTRAARDACLADKKNAVRVKLEMSGIEKRITDATITMMAEKDSEYRRLVSETISSEAVYDTANGRLQAAFTKASMLKGLLFATGKEIRVNENPDMSVIPDLSVADVDFNE